MNLVLWHGYLLWGTGSNIYTQNIARAWARLGHDVRVFCQDPSPPPMGERVRVIRPEIGPLLPTFVLDRYEGVEARLVGELSDDELMRYLDLNMTALAEQLDDEPADLVVANHAIMGGPVAEAGCAPSGTRYAVYLHGSELEYAIRGNARLAGLAQGPLNEAFRAFAGSRHIVDVARELLGEGAYLDRTEIAPPGVDVDAFTPEAGSIPRLLELLRGDVAGAHAERHPDSDAAARLERVGPFVLFFGKLLRQKGVHLLLEAWRGLAQRHPDMTLVVVGFGGDREWLESEAGERVVFTGAMDHPQLQALIPCAELAVVPSVLPEAFGMVAAEAASCGVMTVVSNHSGLAEVAAGLGDAARTFDGTSGDLERVMGELLAMPEADRRAAGLRGRRRVLERWSWERVAERLISGIPQSGEGTSP